MMKRLIFAAAFACPLFFNGVHAAERCLPQTNGSHSSKAYFNNLR
jgi:hypothetical protein